jgi:hypothetical protein
MEKHVHSPSQLGRRQSPIVRIVLRPPAIRKRHRPQAMTRGRERPTGADASLRSLPDASYEAGYEDNHDHKGHLDIINHT